LCGGGFFWAEGVAFYDGLVGNRLVGVTGNDRIVDVGDGDTGPAVVDLAVDEKLEAQITIGDARPWSREARARVLKEPGHEYALIEIRRTRSKETGRPVRDAEKSGVGGAGAATDEVAGGGFGQQPEGMEERRIVIVDGEIYDAIVVKIYCHGGCDLQAV